MHVLLTGGTGFIGAAVLRDLLTNGHTVTALVRSEDSAAKVKDAGATPLIGDISDTAWLTEQLVAADASIHTASPGDATSSDVDRSVADAVARAFAGTGKPHVHTGGVWVYGNRHDVTEDLPYDPPAITAWRGGVEQLVLDADTRTVLVVPAQVYGNGSGIPAAAIVGAPRTDGALHLVGDGTQSWTTVHVDDLADLYVRALENDSASGRYIADAGVTVTQRELAEAYARGAGLGGRVLAETVEQTHERFGEFFGDALLLDQQVVSTKALDELGWKPAGPSLAEELETGSYAG